MLETATVTRTELARKTRQILDRVRRGQTVVVKGYGEEQVVVMDITDYRLLRAIAAYQSLPSHPAPINDERIEPRGLTEEEVEEAVRRAEGDPQARWDRVMAAYLDGHISLGRAAELLGLTRYELQERLGRLGLPLRIGPATIEEARAEVEALRRW